MKIAWQYEKYAGKERGKDLLEGVPRPPHAMNASTLSYCHDLDISVAWKRSTATSSRIVVLSPATVGDISTLTPLAFARVVQERLADTAVLDSFPRDRLVRVVVENVGPTTLWAECDASPLVWTRLVRQLRHVLQSQWSACGLLWCCMATATATLQSTCATLFRTLAVEFDGILSFQSFIGSSIDVSQYELKEYSGLVRIRKVAAVGVIAPYAPESAAYMFKMRRTRVVFEKVQSPPEESRETNASRPRFDPAAPDAVLSCATSGGANSRISTLDF